MDAGLFLTKVLAISSVEKSLVRNSKLMVVFCRECSSEHSTLRSPPSGLGVTLRTRMLGPRFWVFFRLAFLLADLSASPVSESAVVLLSERQTHQ